MNSIIKLISLLLLSTSLFGTELTLVIPEEFKKGEPPLPPLPGEVIRNLPEVDYSRELFDIRVWVLPQEAIHYNYYPQVLNLFTPNKYLLKGEGLIGIYREVTSSLRATLKSNNYLLSIQGSRELTENSLVYRDYHLPISLGIEVIPFSERLVIDGKYRNYSHNLSINGVLDLDNIEGSINYRGNSFLYNFFEVGYKNTLYGTVATGKRSMNGYFLAGISMNQELFQPYINTRVGSRYIFEIDSGYSDVVQYSISIGYKNYISLGVGYSMEYDLNPLDPLLVIKSDYMGSKKIVLGQETIEGDLSFYINDLTLNLIFNYKNHEIYSSLEAEYNNWSYGLIWDDYDIFAKLGYEVVL